MVRRHRQGLVCVTAPERGPHSVRWSPVGTKHGKGGVSKSTAPREGYERPAKERFRARVKVNGKEHFIGYYGTEAAAHRAAQAFHDRRKS